MKTILSLCLLAISHSAMASGWMTLDILPGSVFTSTGEGHIAIMREQKSPFPSENYQCTLHLKGDLTSVSKKFEDGTNWNRREITAPLAFTDSWSRSEEILTADRSSECLEWGEEYEEEGRPIRDCIRHERNFKTVVNILEMRPMKTSSKGFALEVHCEKWMSERVFTNLDNFFHAMYKSRGNLPLNLDLELD